MTPAQRAGIERAKARRAAMTPEERAEWNRKRAEAMKAGRERTPEERRLYSNALKLAWNRKPENRKRLLKLRKKHSKKYYLQGRTRPGALERKAAYMTVWHAKHKDRRIQEEKERLARMRVENPKAYARHVELRRAAQRRRWAEKRLAANAGDPQALAFFAKHLEQQREKYERIKADPVAHAAYRARAAVYVQRQLEKRKRMRKLRAPKDAAATLAALEKLVPRHLPLEVRGDALNELYADLLAEVITLDQVPANLPKYTRQAWKLLGDWKQSSLDDVIPGRDDGLTYKDALASDVDHV